MSVATILYIILSITIFEFFLTKYLGYLNTKNWSDDVPEELKDIYDEEKYKKSQQYEREKYRFSQITGGFSFALIFLVLVF